MPVSDHFFVVKYLKIGEDTWGVAINQIKKIGKALANTTGQEENEAVRHLFQRLAVLLVKGNAALFINWIPTFPGPEVNGMD